MATVGGTGPGAPPPPGGGGGGPPKKVCGGGGPLPWQKFAIPDGYNVEDMEFDPKTGLKIGNQTANQRGAIALRVLRGGYLKDDGTIQDDMIMLMLSRSDMYSYIHRWNEASRAAAEEARRLQRRRDAMRNFFGMYPGIGEMIRNAAENRTMPLAAVRDLEDGNIFDHLPAPRAVAASPVVGGIPPVRAAAAEPSAAPVRVGAVDSPRKTTEAADGSAAGN